MSDFIQSIPPWFWIALVVHGTVLGAVAYLILLERKVASWVQDRLGPNRVGPFGLLQPLADGLKFIVKEDYRPGGVDKILFTLAPGVMILVVIVSIAVIPWGGWRQTTRTVDASVAPTSVVPANGQLVKVSEVHTTPAVYMAGEISEPAKSTITVTYQYPFQVANLNIGVLFILGILSLAVYGIVIGGWASNNKYSFLGALRATANMISYEIPLGLAVLSVVTLFGTLDLGEIVQRQAHYWGGVVPAWNVFSQPLAFALFLVCIHAEANRAPFDLAEAEQELVGGYHTEYSSMRFALFFLAEYAGMITTSAVCVALFFGGWHVPWLDKLWPALAGNVDPVGNPAITTSMLACLVRCAAFFLKTIGVIFIFMWVRWSLPRFRFDQVMHLAWRALIPMSLALLMVTALGIYFFGQNRGDNYLWLGGKLALVMLVANLAVVALFLVLSLVVPAAPDTNRRVRIVGSRFNRLPAALPTEA